MFLKSERAAVELTGHAIVLGLTVMGIAMITLASEPSIIKLQDMASSLDMEQAYTVLDSYADQAAFGDAPQEIIDLALGGGYISAQPNSSSEQSYILFESGTNGAKISIPMGKIIYRKEDREIAYEGGGVWSRYQVGSVMISPPAFDYNGVTLDLPVVNISGNFSAGGKGVSSLIIRKKSDAQILYPGASYGNPVPSRINITIKSEYYDAWADYFGSMSWTRVNVSPAEKKVTVILDPPPVVANISYGLMASRKITMKNNAITYSYNSSSGDHTGRSENGSIRANWEIVLGKAVVNGDALTGGDITDWAGGHGNITKKACARYISENIAVGEMCPAVAEFNAGSASNIVQARASQYASLNDNSKTSSGRCLRDEGNRTLDGTGPGWADGSCTISTGNYYLTEFMIPDNKILKFNTTSGAVNIAVDSSDVTLKKGSNIIIENGGSTNPVILYLNRGIDIEPHVEINPTTRDKAALFQVVSSSSQNMDFRDNNVSFCGLLWAPEAGITIGNKMQVYGALVGKDITLDQDAGFYFDESLQYLPIGLVSGIAPQYVYISRNDIEMSLI